MPQVEEAELVPQAVGQRRAFSFVRAREACGLSTGVQALNAKKSKQGIKLIGGLDITRRTRSADVLWKDAQCGRYSSEGGFWGSALGLIVRS
eukprot:9500762-Pyramimonas_sp.AAC.2